MPDMASLVTSISTLVVAVSALVVSVGVFYLTVRIGRAVETLVGRDDNNRPGASDRRSEG